MVPMAVVAVYWSVGWPMFNVLNKEASHAAVYAASLASIGLSLFVVWLCTIATGHYDWLKERKGAEPGEAADLPRLEDHDREDPVGALHVVGPRGPHLE